MQEFLKEFSSKLEEVGESIKMSLIEASQVNPNASVPELLEELEHNKSKNASVFTSLLKKAGERMSEQEINNFYLGILTDLFRLTNTALEIEEVMAGYERLSMEKVNQIKQSVNGQKSQLRELKFLRDNRNFLEAFDQDLGKNRETGPDKTVYNKKESTISLATYETTDVFSPEVSVKFLGNPERKILPNYDSSKIMDTNNLTSWFEIVGFKNKPKFWVDLASTSVEAYLQGNILLNPNLQASAGSNQVPVDVQAFRLGEWISLSNPYNGNHESATVVNIDTANNILTLDKNLLYDHYVGESIFKGKDLIQANGAVAVITVTFPFPQKVNFMRLLPFSSSPMKVHGIFVPTSDTERPWKVIEGSQVDTLEDITSKTFALETSSEYRIVLEQSHGGILDKPVNAGTEIKELSWDSVYEEEFHTKTHSLETKMMNLDAKEVKKANDNNQRAFLIRKGALTNITSKNSSTKDGTTLEEMNTQLANLNEFVGKPGEVLTERPRLIRYVYEIGLTEVQFINNVYKPHSFYEGLEVNPKQNATIYSLSAEEEIPDDTSVQYFLKIETGEEVPIPNTRNLSSLGAVVSVNELLDVDPKTRKAILNFEPFRSTVEIVAKREGSADVFFDVTVVGGRSVTIPDVEYSQKYVFQVSYPVKESKVYLASSLSAKPNVEVFEGTDSEGFIQLSQNPYIDLGIINDQALWRKQLSHQSKWNLVVTDTTKHADKAESFPLHGFVSNNNYYGYAGNSPIVRTTELEDYLLTFFSKYSGDSVIWTNRFFNKYAGKVLEPILSYEPIRVKVKGSVAFNLANYDGNPHSGFLGNIPLWQQYRHSSNRLFFGEPLDADHKVEVEYSFKEATIQPVAKLFCNKKSNFWTTPLVKNILVSTLG